MHGTNSCEDYDGAKMRRNPYEEALFRIEEERFEVDMAVERNALAMRQIEPIAEEVAMLRETEEKDGQPIGRLQYKLKSKTLNSIQINAVGRIYGDMGDEVIEHLARNPLGTIPIIYQRLRQKDQEWRKQKSELLAKWRSMTEANYEGSRDVMCYKLKRDIEKSLSDERLLEECKKARSFCSSLEKRSGSSINFGLSSPDRSAVLYEPYGVVELKLESAAHELAVKLLTQQLDETIVKGTSDRDAIRNIMSEFLLPFFEYPDSWMSDDTSEASGPGTVAPQCKRMHSLTAHNTALPF
jgi:Sin3 family co-repressor